jgi:hypothetical protein
MDEDNVIRGPWPRRQLSDAETIAQRKVADLWWKAEWRRLAQMPLADEDDLGEWLWGPGYRNRGSIKR